MNSRERVLASLGHQEPDRVPFTLENLTPGFAEKFFDITGSEDAFDYLGADTRHVYFGELPVEELEAKYRRYQSPDVERFNDWGTGFKRGSMYHFEHFIPSLEGDIEFGQLEEYPLPDYRSETYWLHLQKEVDQYHERGLAVFGHLEMTLFEVAWQIRGMESFMTDMYLRPSWNEFLLDRITEIRIFMAEKMAQAGVDVLRLGDDIATQRGMIMSVEHWRRFFQPRLKTMIDHARAIKPDLHVSYHSDGDPSEAIPALMNAGVDVLNPVQPECIDPRWVKKTYGARLSLFGTIGTQSVLPFGTVGDVRENTRDRISTLKSGGGLLLAPTHVIEPDVPVENLIAFAETVREHG